MQATGQGRTFGMTEGRAMGSNTENSTGSSGEPSGSDMKQTTLKCAATVVVF